MKVSFKTMSIKCRVYNFIRTALYKKRLEDITDAQKIELFDQIFAMNKDAHWDLINYKDKRKEKARIYAIRQEAKELQK